MNTQVESKVSDYFLITTKQFWERLGIAKNLFFKLKSIGRIGPMPIELGSKILWNPREIEKWCDAGCPCREKWIPLWQELRNNGAKKN